MRRGRKRGRWEGRQVEGPQYGGRERRLGEEGLLSRVPFFREEEEIGA